MFKPIGQKLPQMTFRIKHRKAYEALSCGVDKRSGGIRAVPLALAEGSGRQTQFAKTHLLMTSHVANLALLESMINGLLIPFDLGDIRG